MMILTTNARERIKIALIIEMEAPQTNLCRKNKKKLRK